MGSDIKISHEEIWYWYQTIEEQKLSGMNASQYCKTHKIDYKRFRNMLYRIVNKKESKPELYAKHLQLVHEYLNSDIRLSKFVTQNNLKHSVFSWMITHVGYLKIIEEMKADKEPQAMQFVKVPQPITSNHVQDAHLVEKQNDIEIVITKGVKVSISPNIDSTKIIKIIECLKDL